MPSGDTERELRQVAESLVLAERMFRKGRIAEAEPMYERSLAMLLRTYAEAHPDIDACLLRLGDIYFAREKFAQALSTYSRLHGLRSRMLSVHHADTIAISFKIAKSQEQLERFDEAARTYEEAISLGEQWLPAGFPLIGSMMESYAILLRKYMNQPRVASEVDQRAKEYRKKYTGKKTVQQAWQIKATPTPTLAPALAPTPPQAQAPTPLQAPTPPQAQAPTPLQASTPPQAQAQAPTPLQAQAPNPTRTPAPNPTLAPDPAPRLSIQESAPPLDPGKVTSKFDSDSATAADTALKSAAKPSPDVEKEAARGDVSHDDDEYDDDYDEDDDEDYEDERPAPKNYLLIAFIVFAAVVVPSFVGWIVMTRHPQIELAQPTSQPASIGGTTMPVTNMPGGDATINRPPADSQPADTNRSQDFAPVEKRAAPIIPDSR